MKKGFFLFIFVSAALANFLLCGCKDSSTNAGIPGTMVGYVLAIDSTGTSHDNSGVRISIDGTNYSTLSDSKGIWELDNVIPGTYNISFTKDGYAMEKNVAYRFVGNGTDYLFTTTVYQILLTNASIVIRPFVNDSAFFSCRLFRQDSSKSLYGAAMLLFGKNHFLSPEKPDSYTYEADNLLGIVRNGIAPDNIFGYTFQIDSSNLYRSGFHSNDTIFCEAFTSNLVVIQQYDAITDKITFGPSYLDIITGKRVYTGFGNNHSEVKSFILP